MVLRKTNVLKKKKVSNAKSPRTQLSQKLANVQAVDPGSMGISAEMLHDYEAAMEQMCKKGVIPGCASIVIHKGAIIHTGEWGFADVEKGTPFKLDTLCRLHCATKSFMATAFFTLVEEGLASPEDRLDKFLPAFAEPRVQLEGSEKTVPAKCPIRIKHLMSHTSGLAYAPDLGETPEPGDAVALAYSKLQQGVLKGSICTLKRFVDGLAKVPLYEHPGRKYNYGFSYDVLARVIEVIAGKSIDKVLTQRVFKPLGIRDVKWAVPRNEQHRLAVLYGGKGTWKKLSVACQMKGRNLAKPSRPTLYKLDGNTPQDSHWCEGQQCSVLSGGGFMGYLFGGLVGSVADTAKFVRMLASGGLTESGHRLLQKSTIAVMERNRIKPDQDPVNFLGNIGVFKKGGTEYGMGGAGCTYWSIDREDDVHVVWFTQHIDMPDFTELKGIDPKKADLWGMMHKAVIKGRKLKKGASKASKSKKKA